jgi:hypothetical protein
MTAITHPTTAEPEPHRLSGYDGRRPIGYINIYDNGRAEVFDIDDHLIGSFSNMKLAMAALLGAKP